jgi:hypothetical protein
MVESTAVSYERYLKAKVVRGFSFTLWRGIDGGEWSAPFPGHFNLRKEPQYPLNRRLEGGGVVGVGILLVWTLQRREGQAVNL